MSKGLNYSFKYGFLILFGATYLCFNSCSLQSLRVISKAELKSPKEAQLIDFYKTLGLIVVPVKIEGEVYRFIFDTGAQTTIISKHLSKKFNLEKKGSIPVRDSHHSTERLNVGIVKEMEIEDLQYSNVGVVVNDFRDNLQFTCLGIDGILGMNVIHLNNWKIDYDKNEITALNGKSKISSQGTTPLLFRIKRGTPYIKLYVNGDKEEFLLDIGKNGTALSISPRVGIKEYNNKLIGYSSFGMHGKMKFDTVRYAQVELSDGSYFYKKDVIVSQTAKSNFVIGTGYIEKYYQYIILDFKRNVLYMKGRNNEDNHIYNYPFSAMLLPEAIVVGSKESDFSSLNLGDTIVAVNGVSYNQNGCELLNEIWDSKNRRQDSLSIKIVRNHAISELLIPIKSILEKE